MKKKIFNLNANLKHVFLALAWGKHTPTDLDGVVTQGGSVDLRATSSSLKMSKR